MSTPPPPPDGSDHGLRALERLRERVEQAATEIGRLREENTQLARRVDELAALAGDAAGVRIGGDAEALREQVEDFIDAIDRMLADPPSSEAPSNGSSD